jgi:hypothetical protein
MSRKYNNYGRDQINVDNIQGNLVVHKQERPRNEQILLKAVRDEVEIRLASSLHNAVFLNLAKEAQPDQVKRPWDSEIKIGAKAVQAIPDNTTIAKIFDFPEIKGKLLILGQPGAGKTTTLLDLTEALVKKAEEDASYPIPVLFNLSSWKDEKQPIRDWMVSELKSKYGVSTKLGKEWIKERVLLPLLDGLDEVAPEQQEKCVQQINTFLAGEAAPLYTVVCSRIAEYENYETTLQLNGAIYLKELSDQQMQEYLIRVERAELWRYISQNSALLEFIRAPLLLSMAILAYPQGSTAQWQQLQTSENQLQHLLDGYVERMLYREVKSRAYRKQKVPTVEQTRWWLRWLAQHMEKSSQTEFLIEEMQPSILLSHQLRIYRLIVRLILGLSFGLIFWLMGNMFLGWLVCGWILWYVNRASVRRGDGQIPVFKHELSIKPTEAVRWTRMAALTNSPNMLLGFVKGGVFVGLARETIEIKVIPNQGIKLSGKMALISGLFLGLLSGLFFTLFYFPIFGLIIKMNSIWIFNLGFKVGLPFGLLFGLIFGGSACIKHFILRLLLYQNNAIPWNYGRFLNYCTDRLFLQRVGGRYRFVHKLLQDHFAKMSET